MGNSIASFSDAPEVAVTRWLVADRAATLGEIELPTSKDPRIACTEILKHQGDSVRPPMENADRIGYVMTCAPSRLEADTAAEDLIKNTVIHYL
jgi:hypothetical protein